MRFSLALLVLLAMPAMAMDQDLPDWATPSSANPYDAPAVEAVDGPGLPSAPAPVPLDGGLGLLALAGAGYAAKKLRDRQVA